MKYKLSHEFFDVHSGMSKHLRKFHSKVKLHPGEFSTLTLIHHCLVQGNKGCPFQDLESITAYTEGISISELCERSGSSKPAMSKMISALEDKGYVERAICKEDRRVVNIMITSSGRNMLEESHGAMFDITEQSLLELGEEKVEELMKLLTELNEIFDRRVCELEKRKI